MATRADHRDLMYRVNEELWSEGRLDLVDQYVHPDYVEHHNAVPEPIRGPEGYRQHLRTFRGAFPDLDVETEHIVVEGSLAANHYTLRGTHDGAFLGVAPTGRPVTVSGTSLGRLEDGLVVESWTNADLLGLLTQVGLVERPGP